MRRKHRRTLAAIFEQPVPSGLPWVDVESLLLACGAYIEERKGSRVGIDLNGVVAIFHRPHPRKETDKGAVASMRRFFTEAGIEPGNEGDSP